MKKYALIYFVILGALFGLETTPWAQSFTVGTWTQFLADFSGGLMQLFDPTVVVQGSDIRNRAPRKTPSPWVTPVKLQPIEA